MSNKICLGKNLKVMSVSDLFSIQDKSGINIGERFNLSQFLSDQDQYHEGLFFRWYLESSEESYVIQTMSPQNPEQNLSIECLRVPDGIEINFTLDEEIANPSEISNQKIFYWDNFIKCFDQGVLYISPDGVVDFASREIPNLLEIADGRGITYSSDSLVGKDIFQHLDEDLLKSFKPFILRAQTNRSSRINQTFENENSAINVIGYPIYSDIQLTSLVFLIFDISEKNKAKKQLKKAEETIQNKSHLIALGEMAAGIAHEINTPLAALGLSISMIEKNYEKMGQEKINKTLGRMKQTTNMVAKIVENLLNLSRSNQHEIHNYEEISLLDTVNEMLPLLHQKIVEHSIKLKVDIPENICLDVKKVQFQQVLLNMIKNSIQAISDLDSSGRWVSVTASIEDDMVSILITDAGSGIKEEILKKIDEPFFTTKGVGKGTGLGLSVCKSIIKGHGGILRYCGKENTCFEIILPLKKGIKHAV